MRIIGPPSAPMGVVLDRLGTAALPTHPRFVAEMFHPLWQAGVDHGVDPVVMVGQSYHETGGGRFTGKVPAEFRNTCGLKTRFVDHDDDGDSDEPLDHERFGWWEVGATAHAQHLCAYAGQPVHGLLVDPRFDFARNQLVAKRGGWPCEQVEDLDGMWGTSPGYGQRVAAVVLKLQGRPS